MVVLMVRMSVLVLVAMLMVIMVMVVIVLMLVVLMIMMIAVVVFMVVILLRFLWAFFSVLWLVFGPVGAAGELGLGEKIKLFLGHLICCGGRIRGALALLPSTVQQGVLVHQEVVRIGARALVAVWTKPPLREMFIIKTGFFLFGFVLVLAAPASHSHVPHAELLEEDLLVEEAGGRGRSRGQFGRPLRIRLAETRRKRR